MKRYGFVIKVAPGMLEEYKRLHANPWPGINEKIKECNITNYTIYHRDGLLFGYYEYVGEDYEADMARMGEDPQTQKWWDACYPCLETLPTVPGGRGWADMEEIYHLD